MTHYRQRCRFSMVGRFGGVGSDELNYSMFNGQIDEVVSFGFRLASERLNKLMPLILTQLRRYEALGGNRLRAVHLHAPRSKESAALITLLYGAPIDNVEAWKEVAIEARSSISNEVDTDVYLIGRCKGLILISGSRCTYEELIISISSQEDEKICLEFPESSFCHPNTRANERSVTWLRKQLIDTFTKRERPRMLEIYCGSGNHTCCLAKLCASLTIVEVDDQLVQAAKRNLQNNNCNLDRITFVTADAQKFCKRILRRATRYSQLDFDIILVDPPRRGTDRNTLDLLKHFPHILYISCNPLALQSDMQELINTHEVLDFAFLDAFPSTPHLECLVHFTLR